MNESILKSLRSQGFSTYEIAEKLNCSQTNVRYWLKKINFNLEKKCLTCNKILNGKKTSFCSLQCKNKNSNKKNNSYAQQKERGIKRKIDLVKMKGGCCEICGYCKNYAALQFHHEDPTKKDAGLDSRKLSNSTWEWCVSEVQKCKLLCANCHLETHHPSFAYSSKARTLSGSPRGM